jgi:fructosamine-3-kinase
VTTAGAGPDRSHRHGEPTVPASSGSLPPTESQIDIDDIFYPGERLETVIHRIAGDGVSVRSSRRIGGGSINETARLTLSDGAELFVKRNASRHGGLFREEARGLRALRRAARPRVPEPIAIGEDGGTQFLLLEYVPTGERGATFSAELGEQLATLHRTLRSDRCGFDRDNHIGSTPQLNGWDPDWHRFFGEMRLVPQMERARAAGYADAGMEQRLGRVVSRLSELLPHPDSGGASLLHGDLWGGNVIAGPEGEPVLIDPAVYYGHREADLAMTELFGGFGSAFLRRYREVWALEPGYEDRRDLYNLYHLLNHLNLFGTGYLGSCTAILRRYG